VLLSRGRSHRTTTDAELIRWGADFVRVEGAVQRTDRGRVDVHGAVTASPGSGSAAAPIAGPSPSASGETIAAGPASPGAATLEFALAAGGRKKIAVNGVPRRPAALAEHLRIVLFAPEEMLLVIGPPGLRRSALDDLVEPQDPRYAADMATYTRALQQRNSLLRLIREEQASRDQLRLWDEPFLAAGAGIVAARRRVLAALAQPLADAHREIAPGEGRLEVAYSTNAQPLPGESPRDTLARRLAETADKEAWNGSTLIGPHRDDLVFSLDGRDLATFASRGQQRTAILAFKLAELDLLTAHDGRPPLLLLDDVFSELDPERRGHLVRRIAGLPQALVTTTHLDDIDPELRRHARSWRVSAGTDGSATVVEAV